MATTGPRTPHTAEPRTPHTAEPRTTEPRTRRRQAERSAATRRKVIDAAIACIAEEGFRRATTTRVARRAGVTWGAIQHQFGDKDSILRAVMQRGVDELGEEYRRVPADLPLRERIHVVVERTWDVLNRPFFRAFVEVALATREGPHGTSSAAELQDAIVDGLRGLWSNLLVSERPPTARAMAVERLAFHALGGAALEALLRPDSPPTRDEIALLEELLYQALSD